MTRFQPVAVTLLQKLADYFELATMQHSPKLTAAQLDMLHDSEQRMWHDSVEKITRLYGEEVCQRYVALATHLIFERQAMRKRLYDAKRARDEQRREEQQRFKQEFEALCA